MGRYDDLYQKSINDPEGFWGEAAKAITWSKKWDKVLDDSNKPFARWFSGGEMNTCFNALDRHVHDGRGDQVALIYDSPVTMGRVDDVINVAGHRLSTGEMEEVVSTHKDVAECAVIGVHDGLKGQLPLGLGV